MANRTLVQLPSNLSVRDISIVHGKLAEVLDQSESISLVVPDDAVSDISFVQLVEAARVKAEVSGKTIALASPAKGNLREVLDRCGLLTDASRNDLQFWLHEETVQ
ncbi:hypothetical protein [Oryzibacter oryziterrae]|uniref:hypothetical protein n=1 Tax=Oryzibacter oryziterrae TaxID=2766474 RepID=UPI001F2FFC2C|nr:hypothetical protein [Oryzibacter oryziterrae]